jgi:hypothetical protein
MRTSREAADFDLQRSGRDCSALENGCPLAVLDSIDITIKRTAAASAVAAKYLAEDSSVATIAVVGSKPPQQRRALQRVLPMRSRNATNASRICGASPAIWTSG